MLHNLFQKDKESVVVDREKAEKLKVEGGVLF